MTEAAGEDEDVPDEMVVAYSFQRVEGHARRVGQPARQYPRKANDRHVQPDGARRDQC